MMLSDDIRRARAVRDAIAIVAIAWALGWAVQALAGGAP